MIWALILLSQSLLHAAQSRFIIIDSNPAGNYEIYRIRTDGSDPLQLTNDTSFDSWWGRISPDARRILFYRTPKGVHDRNYGLTSLWMMNADGSDARQIIERGGHGWLLQGHAEWSPDGTKLVMFGTQAGVAQVFITDTDGQDPKLVTDRPGMLSLDPAFSPDGGVIVFTGCPTPMCRRTEYEIFSIPASGGVATRLTFNDLIDNDPYYSPDGARIAWLTNFDPSAFGGIGTWGISMMNADGTEQVAIVRDGQITSKPQWSADGRTIYTHRVEPGVTARWGIYRMNPDGSVITIITDKVARFDSEYPSADFAIEDEPQREPMVNGRERAKF